MKRSIDTISIIGAGALGAAYGGLFYDMDMRSVSFVAGGKRFERLRKEGLIVNGKHYFIPVVLPGDLSAPADLVIVAVKHHHLGDVIRDMRNRVGAGTTIISVMNGIESEERLGAVYGIGKVLYAVSVGIDALREGNRVKYTNQGKIFFGEARNAFLTDRVKRIQALFDKAGIIYETPPDMKRVMWWKFMINVGINQASAVLRAPFALFQTSGEARNLMESAMWEVIRLSEKAEVNLTEDDVRRFNEILPDLNPQGKTSMLQDVEAGRKTEVEMFAGKVIALGRQYDVPTPVNQRLFYLIKEIEAQY
ncbi:MAG TPA: 2-dehydropantoate 2-reductase [Syntrophales bacterium]|nr:2-dehydropantoate 2-reductase [Syntrophales bacterium]